MRARVRTRVWVDWVFRVCVDCRCGACFLFSTELVIREGSFLCLFWFRDSFYLAPDYFLRDVLTSLENQH